MHAELFESLQHDRQHADELHALLLREQQALRDRQLSTLQEELGRKQFLLSQLESGSRTRTQLLQQLGLPATLNSLKKVAQDAPNGEQLLEAAHEVDTRLRECRDANELNGRLMRASQNSVNQLLSVLRGQEKPLYNRYGSNASGNNPRPLSSA
ncbi:flagella synthesis protein FlgN [Atopomonas hussainii]|uniref:flagella synthesis protein FlgN n=1 Tax=Atopomonas hussainii TaxID=1429083 RepID=UPI0009004E02|nr:flagellar protein FlgN [Atopomonas hussainii]